MEDMNLMSDKSAPEKSGEPENDKEGEIAKSS